MSETGLHPLDLLSGELAALGCTSLEQALRLKGRVCLLDARARLEPGAAILSPTLWAAHTALLRDARALIVEGTLEGAELGFTRLENGTPLELEASGSMLDGYAQSRGWARAAEVVARAAQDEGAASARASG